MRADMMRLLFQNSRMALAFVVLTVLGAAAIIGPQGNGGLVTQAVSLSESQRGFLSGARQAGAAGQSQKAAPPSVFGDFDPQAGATAAPVGPGAGAGEVGNPMTAPLAPSAVVAGPANSDPIIPEENAAQ